MGKNYFEGLRILDHTRYLLGGYATQVFADLGAEVIKVEDTKVGDFCRYEEPTRNDISYYFGALNRNKKSISINLKSEEGLQAYYELLKTTDVVLESFRPGVCKKLGIDFETEKKYKPDIIHAAFTAFGQDDPRSLKAFHDINLQAYSGYLSVNGGVVTPIHMVDVSTGMVAVQSVMAALLQREATGEGSFCDVKMLDSFVWWNSLLDARYDFYGNKLTRELLDYPVIAYNVYKTKDDRFISVGMLEEKFWMNFLNHLGRPDFQPYKLCRRFENPERFAEMEEIFASKTYAEWEQFLNEIDCCSMPVRTKEEGIDALVGSGTGIMEYCDFSRTGKTLQTRIPIDIGIDVSLKNATQAPLLGENTEELLLSAGYSKEQIDAMIEKGAVRKSE